MTTRAAKTAPSVGGNVGGSFVGVFVIAAAEGTMIHSPPVNRPKRPRRTRSQKQAAKQPRKQPTLPRDQRPPAEVTRDLFLVWRMPRLGMNNPQRMSNPVWCWLAQQRELNAYMANLHFAGPSSMRVGPCWCASRYGQSETVLPDGRSIRIGGEHEDYYDPDFYIYNDVLVTSAAGEVEVYGYPHEVLPPTDFHSATLVGDRIMIIGGLGYPAQRVPTATPVHALDLRTLTITRLATTGALPGWLFKHQAALSADGATIIVSGGERIVQLEGDQQIRENHDDWALDLERLTWTRLTDRRWQQWSLTRADRSANHLFTIWCMAWHADERTPFDREQMAEHEKELGWRPDFTLHAARYAPPLPHTTLPEVEGDSMTTRISIDGVTVRYVEQRFGVNITVEGALPPEQVQILIEDARSKLEALDRSPHVARLLEG
jgi:hypothetical protein